MNICCMQEQKIKQNKWYFDSGCSRHMTHDASELQNYRPHKGLSVSFGGGVKGESIGVGDLVLGKTVIIDVYHISHLMYKLIYISQICDLGMTVLFDARSVSVKNKNEETVIKGKRVNLNYIVDWESAENGVCLTVQHDQDQWLWHKNLCHMNFKNVNRLVTKSLVRGLPARAYRKDGVCSACQMGKQVRSFFKSISQSSSERILNLLHMDLFGPVTPISVSGRKYTLVVVDDYSKYTGVIFLMKKKETKVAIPDLINLIENESNVKVTCIRSDKGTEFLNEVINDFCCSKGIRHQLSAARTPQQNGLAERRNRTLKEASRTMIAECNISEAYWAEAVNSACYTRNRALINKDLDKTPYEVYKGKKPNISHLRIFGCKCFVLNNGKDQLRAFQAKADEGFFLGYSATSKAVRVLNKRTLKVEESIHVVFDENPEQFMSEEDLAKKFKELLSNEEEVTDATPEYRYITLEGVIDEAIENAEIQEARENPQTAEQSDHSNENSTGNENSSENVDSAETQNSTVQDLTENPNGSRTYARWTENHPQDFIIGSVTAGVRTRRNV